MASTVNGCVAKLLKVGLITRPQAQAILNAQTAAARAGQPQPGLVAIAAAKQSIARKQYLAALQASVINDLLTKAAAHPKGFSRGVQSLLARDVTGKAKWANVDYRRIGIMNWYTSQIVDAMDVMRPKMAGLSQDAKLLDDISRELDGAPTGNAEAARAAKQLADLFENVRTRFNDAGGDIPKRADWGRPQHHDAIRISEAGKAGWTKGMTAAQKSAASRAAWKSYITPLLDPQRMRNVMGLPPSPTELDASLDFVYETITTRGLNKMVPGQAGGKKLANMHADSRYLVFKDADARLAYDKQYGGGNLHQQFMDYLQEMSGDTALLEIMGPNPTHTYRVLRDSAQKEGVEGLDLAMTDAIWHSVGGRNTAATLSLQTVEKFAAIRNFMTANFLGSAVLSTPSDIAFLRQTAAWNGLSFTRIMGNYTRTLNPANAADRKAAGRALVTLNAWMGLAGQSNRFSELSGTGAMAKAADFVVRAQGLSAHTHAGQTAIGLEWLMTHADLRAKTWADLPDANRALMEQAGFEAADWDVLRAGPIDSWGGHEKIALDQLLQSGAIPRAQAQAVVDKALHAMEIVSHFGIPSPDARTRAIGELIGARGTLPRELANMVLQFKSFPMAVILSHGYRIIHAASGLERAQYLVGMTILTTLMGALAIQLKDISKGRSPRDMDNPRFWTAAFAQGGGAGIFGDYVYAGMFGSNRFGSSLAESMAGPTATAATDIMRLTAGNFGETVEGEDTSIGKEAVSFAGRYSPVIGSLWYTRLGYERLVINQLQLMADPRARTKFAQDRARRQSMHGQYDWWRKGETLPEAMSQ